MLIYSKYININILIVANILLLIIKLCNTNQSSVRKLFIPIKSTKEHLKTGKDKITGLDRLLLGQRRTLINRMYLVLSLMLQGLQKGYFSFKSFL